MSAPPTMNHNFAPVINKKPRPATVASFFFGVLGVSICEVGFISAHFSFLGRTIENRSRQRKHPLGTLVIYTRFYNLIVLLVLLHGTCACSTPHETNITAINIVPQGVDQWAVRTTGSSKLIIDGIEQKDRYQRVPGSTHHTVQFADKVYQLPSRDVDNCGVIRFVALGDGRADVNHIGPSAYWPGILHEVYTRQPTFILNTGDLVKRGHRIHEWINFFHQTRVLPPMVSVRGNHDRGGLFETFIAVDRFVHWFRWGAVGVVGFDTEILDHELEASLALLDKTLMSLNSHWKILFLHRPIWSRGNHGSNERGWNEKLIPIIDRHSVDIVIAGHDHNYERFCASRGFHPSNRCADSGFGTTYIVTGGAATFTNPVPGISKHVDGDVKKADALASRVFSGAHHFIDFSASAHRLHATVRRTRTGNLFGAGIIDEFTFDKRNERCQKTSR